VLDVSVSDKSNGIYFSVYPNPVNESATLEISSFESGVASVIVRDPLGKIVREMDHINVSPSAKKIPLERNGLDSGIYFYEVRLAGNQAGTGKLIMN